MKVSINVTEQVANNLDKICAGVGMTKETAFTQLATKLARAPKYKVNMILKRL